MFTLDVFGKHFALFFLPDLNVFWKTPVEWLVDVRFFAIKAPFRVKKGSVPPHLCRIKQAHFKVNHFIAMPTRDA
jgi:hypothetical protein